MYTGEYRILRVVDKFILLLEQFNIFRVNIVYKKKANKGSTAPTTFYYTKDIQYLAHEPVLQKFREHKIFLKKLNKALGKREFSVAKNLEKNRPIYTLDHILKER